VPIPWTADVVKSSVFEPLHYPVWCCDTACDTRYVTRQNAHTIEQDIQDYHVLALTIPNAHARVFDRNRCLDCYIPHHPASGACRPKVDAGGYEAHQALPDDWKLYQTSHNAIPGQLGSRRHPFRAPFSIQTAPPAPPYHHRGHPDICPVIYDGSSIGIAVPWHSTAQSRTACAACQSGFCNIKGKQRTTVYALGGGSVITFSRMVDASAHRTYVCQPRLQFMVKLDGVLFN
jgi:hypothetical protein